LKELYDENIEKTGSFLKEFYQNEQKYKTSWAQQAKRQVAYANGDQNVDPPAAPIMSNNQPVNTVANKRQRMYQTNEIAPIIRTLSSYMGKTRPVIDTFPDSHSQEAKNIARISEKVTEAKYEIDHESQNSRMAAHWALTLGTAFGKDFWDTTRGQYVGVVDEKGNPIFRDDGSKVEARAGNNNTAILTPLSVTGDHSVLEFDDQPLVGEHYMMDVDWARQAFDQDMPGYTGKAKEIKEDSSAADALAVFEGMKFALPYVTQGHEVRSKGKCLVSEWYIRPNNEWRKGRMVINAGGQWVYDSSKEEGSPYFMPFEETMWHPYSCFIYETYVGRFLGKSLVEQLIALQMRINEINGAILENANTLAKPNIMAAINQLKRGVINGKGAQIYTFQPVPGAPPPSFMKGTPLPAQFFEERQMLIDEMVRIAGTNFIMQGGTPPGVTAAAALQMLLESASGQQSDMMVAWEKFHERRFTKKLRVLKAFHKHADKQLAQYVRIFSKDSLDKAIEDFVGVTDLADEITIKVQKGSMIPKSEIARRELYEKLGEKGLLGPLNAPGPEGMKLRNQMLERIGEKALETDDAIEIKKAKWENERIKQGKPVELSPYDNNAIHLVIHKMDIQNPKFLETADDVVKEKLDDHIKETQAAVQKAEQAKEQKEMQKAQMQADLAAKVSAGGKDPRADGMKKAADAEKAKAETEETKVDTAIKSIELQALGLETEPPEVEGPLPPVGGNPVQ